MDTAERLLALLGLLQHRAHWSADDLASRLEVTTRTVRRDVTRLRSYGYPVEAFAGHGGGYRLGNGARLPPLLLDDDEVLAVVVGLGAVGTAAVAGLDDAVVSALGKLEQVMPARLRSRLDAIGTAVVHASSVPGPSVDRRTLTSLAHAVSSGVVVEFCYVDARGSSSHRRVEPVRLVRVGRGWYLASYDLERGDWRTFRLDRITSVDLLAERVVRRDGPDPLDLVARSAPSTSYAHRVVVEIDAPPGVVRERIPAAIAAVLEGRAADIGSTVVEIGTDDVDWLVAYLMGLPWDVEVLEPAPVRRLLEGRARRLATRNARRRAAARSPG